MECNQRGSVLLLSLSILTLIAAISLLILTRSTNSALLTKGIVDKDKAELVSNLVLSWAQVSLIEKSESLAFPDTVIEGMTVSGRLIDAQSFLNVNVLKLSEYYDASGVFNRLLEQASPDVDSPDEVTRFIRSWATEFKIGSSQYDNHYRDKPYRPAHAPLVDIQTLRLVNGVTKSLFEDVSPYLVALPVQAKMNVNTINKLLLMTLVEGLTQSQADALIALREQSPFKDTLAFVQNPMVQQHSFHNNLLITTQSQFFLVKAVVTNKASIFHREWLLKRMNESEVEVLWVR